MDITDLQMTFIVVATLTFATVVMFSEYFRKQRKPQNSQRIKVLNTTASRGPIRIVDAVNVDYSCTRRIADEHPLMPLVGTPISARAFTQSRIERELIAVEMAPSSPTAPSFSTEVQLPAFTIDAVLWESLIGHQPKQHLLSRPTSTARGSLDTVEASELPSGTIQQPAFEHLLKSEEHFTGLVVSIGINESDSSMWRSQGLMQSVGKYFGSLLTEKDFSCRTAYDEFVIVCPGERGAQSQRRLNHISEQLWDYQLRGLGACSILFSWGGVQVKDQLLADAFASATERMRETKRSGRSVKSALEHRQVT